MGLSIQELAEASRTIKENSGPGVNGVLQKATKLAFSVMANTFTITINKTLACNDVLAGFTHARTFLLHKEKDVLDVG